MLRNVPNHKKVDCLYIVKTNEGWRQSVHSFELMVSDEKQALVIKNKSPTAAVQYVERWGLASNGPCRAVLVGNKKVKIAYSVMAALSSTASEERLFVLAFKDPAARSEAANMLQSVGVQLISNGPSPSAPSAGYSLSQEFLDNSTADDDAGSVGSNRNPLPITAPQAPSQVQMQRMQVSAPQQLPRTQQQTQQPQYHAGSQPQQHPVQHAVDRAPEHRMTPASTGGLLPGMAQTVPMNAPPPQAPNGNVRFLHGQGIGVMLRSPQMQVQRHDAQANFVKYTQGEKNLQLSDAHVAEQQQYWPSIPSTSTAFQQPMAQQHGPPQGWSHLPQIEQQGAVISQGQVRTQVSAAPPLELTAGVLQGLLAVMQANGIAQQHGSTQVPKTRTNAVPITPHISLPAQPVSNRQSKTSSKDKRKRKSRVDDGSGSEDEEDGRNDCADLHSPPTETPSNARRANKNAIQQALRDIGGEDFAASPLDTALQCLAKNLLSLPEGSAAEDDLIMDVLSNSDRAAMGEVMRRLSGWASRHGLAGPLMLSGASAATGSASGSGDVQREGVKVRLAPAASTSRSMRSQRGTVEDDSVAE